MCPAEAIDARTTPKHVVIRMPKRAPPPAERRRGVRGGFAHSLG